MKIFIGLLVVILLAAGGCNNEPVSESIAKSSASTSAQDKFVDLLIDKYNTSVTFATDFRMAIKFSEIYSKRFSRNKAISPQALRHLRENTLRHLHSLERNQVSSELIKTLLIFRLARIGGDLGWMFPNPESPTGLDWYTGVGTSQYVDCISRLWKRTYFEDGGARLYSPSLFRGIVSFCTEKEIFENCSFVLIQAWMSIAWSAQILHQSGSSQDLLWRPVSEYLDFLDLVVSCPRSSSMIAPFKKATEVLVRLIETPEKSIHEKDTNPLNEHAERVIRDLEHVILPTEC